MANLHDISNWTQLRSYHTGGTRSKKYLQGPDSQYYFFKESQRKQVKDYKYEFWSEIIAYELGLILDIKVLKYEIAIHNNKIGCLSKSMIDPAKEELIELGKYLQTFDRHFEYQEKKPGKTYNFQLIENTLNALGLQKFIFQILEVVVFDAVISNGDRHQENLAFINPFNFKAQLVEETKNIIEEPTGWLRKFLSSLSKEDKIKAAQELDKWKIKNNTITTFSPIYDSGSSLGRELSEEAIEILLSNNIRFERYIKGGKSEIHWEGQKLTHFELIHQLLQQYPEHIRKLIDKINLKFDGQKFRKILENIDEQLPPNFLDVKLSIERKILIEKIVTERIKKLTQIIR